MLPQRFSAGGNLFAEISRRLFQSTPKPDFCQVAELLMPREWCRTAALETRHASSVAVVHKSVRQILESWASSPPKKVGMQEEARWAIDSREDKLELPEF